MTGGSLTASGSGVTFAANSTTTISNADLLASSGAALNLPHLTSYTCSAFHTLEATGGSSSLSMPLLTTLSTSGNQVLNVDALSGGHVTFATLASVTTSPIFFVSSGASSQIDISAITNFQSGIATSASTIQLAGGGTLLDGNNPNTVINDIIVTADAAFTIQSNQTFSSDNASTTFTGGTLVVQGALAALQYATLTISGNVSFNTQGIIEDQIYGTIKVTGNVLGTTQNSTAYNAQGTLILNGSGTVGSPQQLEAMSADLGAVQSGFNNNFAYGILSLANNTYVKLVDLSDNAAGAGAEAVYVKKLVVPGGHTLDLNGLHLYVRDASQVAGTILNGTVTQVTGSVIVNRQIFYSGSSNYDVGNGIVRLRRKLPCWLRLLAQSGA
jgi:hypothetical protein